MAGNNRRIAKASEFTALFYDRRI